MPRSGWLRPSAPLCAPKSRLVVQADAPSSESFLNSSLTSGSERKGRRTVPDPPNSRVQRSRRNWTERGQRGRVRRFSKLGRCWRLSVPGTFQDMDGKHPRCDRQEDGFGRRGFGVYPTPGRAAPRSSHMLTTLGDPARRFRTLLCLIRIESDPDADRIYSLLHMFLEAFLKRLQCVPKRSRGFPRTPRCF